MDFKISKFHILSLGGSEQSNQAQGDNLHNFNFLIVTLLYSVAQTPLRL